MRSILINNCVYAAWLNFDLQLCAGWTLTRSTREQLWRWFWNTQNSSTRDAPLLPLIRGKRASFECGLHPLLLVKFAARAKNPRGWQQRVKFKASHLLAQNSQLQAWFPCTFNCLPLCICANSVWISAAELFLSWNEMTRDCFNLKRQRLKTRALLNVRDVRNLFANSIIQILLCSL
jgi:hypothetical protein